MFHHDLHIMKLANVKVQVVNNVTLPLGYQTRMSEIKRIKSKSRHGISYEPTKKNENFVGIEGTQKLFNLSKNK